MCKIDAFLDYNLLTGGAFAPIDNFHNTINYSNIHHPYFKRNGSSYFENVFFSFNLSTWLVSIILDYYFLLYKSVQININSLDFVIFRKKKLFTATSASYLFFSII